MNKLTIIGNLTKDPELRTTPNGLSVCSFTVAVNRRKKAEGQPEADFFRVSAWRQLAENCHKYLAKGRKVAVVGEVSVSSYEPKSGGGTRFSLEVMADDVEFLSARSDAEPQRPTPPTAAEPDEPLPFTDAGFTEITDDDLPF